MLSHEPLAFRGAFTNPDTALSPRLGLAVSPVEDPTYETVRLDGNPRSAYYALMDEPRVKAVVTRQREFRAFAELSHAHWVILDNAKTKRDGWFYECLTANILAAFKVEAYLNHLGPLLFRDWEERHPWPTKPARPI